MADTRLRYSPSRFVDTLLPALRQAAAIARALEGRVSNRPKEGEDRAAKAALTIADTATQEAILVPLWEHFPKVALEAEEDTESAAHFAARAPLRVVVDPIDGTLHSYLLGEGPYAVMVGLAAQTPEGEIYEAALVALPREEICFDAVRGGGARTARASSPARRASPEPDGRTVYVSHEMPAAVRSRLGERGYQLQPACGGAISVAPLVPGVCGGLRVAHGTVSVRGRIGLVAAREAGAVVCDAGGAPFPEDLHTPAPVLVVAADEATARDLRWCLEALRG